MNRLSTAETNILLYSLSRDAAEARKRDEAARACGCEAVLSEDLHHSQHYGNVRVINPFL